MNDKIYKNKNGDPLETLHTAVIEGALWMEAQITESKEHVVIIQSSGRQSLDNISQCSVDGAWREQDTLTGQGWYIATNTGNHTIGAMNIRQSLSPLHAKCKILIGLCNA